MTTWKEKFKQERLKEFDELTYKWNMAISPSDTYEELAKVFLLETIDSCFAQMEKEKNDSKNSNECFCGHGRKFHTRWDNKGINSKGSRYVCTKDNCHYWNLCDIDIQSLSGKETNEK